MFHGFATPNENEYEVSSSQDDFHKLADLSFMKPNGKSNWPWPPKPKQPRKHWGLAVVYIVCTRQ
jgi:hypothetical protein